VEFQALGVANRRPENRDLPLAHYSNFLSRELSLCMKCDQKVKYVDTELSFIDLDVYAIHASLVNNQLKFSHIQGYTRPRKDERSGTVTRLLK
jgi:hypothetical protein